MDPEFLNSVKTACSLCCVRWVVGSVGRIRGYDPAPPFLRVLLYLILMCGCFLLVLSQMPLLVSNKSIGS
jgi:hypothetical protein